LAKNPIDQTANTYYHKIKLKRRDASPAFIINMQLTDLKYISEKREREFNKLNIYTLEELVRHFPRDYLDLTRVTPLTAAYHNAVILTKCEVLSVEVNRTARCPFVKAACVQSGTYFTAIWFNQLYVATKLKRGDYLFYGRVQNKYGLGCQMNNPTFEPVDKNYGLKGIVPVYSLSGNLTQGVVRVSVKQALQKLPFVSRIPLPLQKKYELISLKSAYEKVHCPKNMFELRQGSERIALEEYFLLVSAFKVIKGDREEARRRKYSVTKDELAEFITRFPFPFTKGQNSAVNAVFKAVHSRRKMNMLLQGDVGSGKTAVALSGVYMAVKSGYQAAMLAPTEVLARQNFGLLQRYFPDYSVALLVGSTPTAEKRAVKAAAANGEIDIVCGTHAVLQDDVAFKNLAFAVCDEQHRFGVAQRSALIEKGAGCDVLVMSATPIPRTLSLILYGDLDVTSITDKPRSRQDISTAIVPERKYRDMLLYVAEQAKLGNQSYFVCPKIEGDDEGTLMSVTELYDYLRSKLPQTRFALLHGKMKEKEKTDIMSAFKAKEYDCLVSTTVIEVGVDVPDATTMIIFDAERFGLSQLHQLRGRVGRGDKKSYCFLLTRSQSEEAHERLSVIKNCSDGFKIAEEDLRLRGGGEFIGTRQSGRLMNEIKNLRFPVDTVITAKAISDDAFSGEYDIEELRRTAYEKYSHLAEVSLN